jgi:hypothetical protein
VRAVLAGAFCAGALMLAMPGTAVADGVTVTPQRVETGGEVVVRVDCADPASAMIESEAFGRMSLDGRPSVRTLVSYEPGRYKVRARCGAEATALDSAWLVIEDDAAKSTASLMRAPDGTLAFWILLLAGGGLGAVFLRRRMTRR